MGFDHAVPTLFQSLLGKDYFRMPPAVRALHALRGGARYGGRASVERGSGPLARLCARVARLPPARVDAPLSVAFDTAPRREAWRRDFDGFAMPSVLVPHAGLLQERMGPLRFGFALAVYDDALHWRVARVRVFGVPLAARWFEAVRCREYERDGRYAFDIQAALPLVGRVVRYHGWLRRED